MGEFGATLLIGNDETRSAKKRRQDAYSRDLVLQMQEKSAAKLREKYQGMSVNASGWLDPEKRPERFKPLGGAGHVTDRSRTETKVRPYHTLFDYNNNEPTPIVTGNNSVDQAYNFFATKDLNHTGPGSFVQPLVVPYVDNRPIILPTPRHDPSSNEYQPKYNPFLQNEETVNKELKAILNISQAESARQKLQLVKETEEQQRKWRKELDDERRKLYSRENQMKKEVDDLRRGLDTERRDIERQRALMTRIKHETRLATHTPPLQVRPASTTLLSEMDETRRRLLDERLAIERLLLQQKEKPKPKPKPVQRRRATPPDPDKATQSMVEEFAVLKNRDASSRQMFRSVYPELPQTNRNLEEQQAALLRQQEHALGAANAPDNVNKVLTFVRPDWMDKAPTPFPHRLRERDRLYSHLELEGRYRRAERREQGLDGLEGWGVAIDPDKVIEKFENMKLGSNRPASTETLCDDTWLAASSVPVI